MEPNTIQKLLNYYYTKLEFKEEISRAIRKFFNKPKLSAGDKIELSDESDEDAFNEWLVFDFCLKNKKKFDSIEEMNQVLQKIIKVWNGLTIKQRKSFEKMDDKKLYEIFKGIQVYF